MINNLKLLLLLVLFVTSCVSTKYRTRYLLPYLDSRKESKLFVDSLIKIGIDTILLYHKKHGYNREYYLFWLDKSDLQLRKINSFAITKIDDYSGLNGFYRDDKIFDFYFKHKKNIDTDSNQDPTSYHYPYVDIIVTIGNESRNYHLPDGINSDSDNTTYHWARLIEGKIYNLSNSVKWKEAEKKYKNYPIKFDRKKKKWQEWEMRKMSNGEIFEDYYH